MSYTSSLRLFGLPLLQISLGPGSGNLANRGVARAWIAIGDVAFGALFSLGGLSVGGFAVGGVSVGLVSFGGLSVGGLALGGLAVGYLAAGGAAVAIVGALGGLAVAMEYALGGAAYGHHANDPAAKQWIAQRAFFTGALPVFRWSWLLAVIAAVAILLVLQLRRRDP